MARDLDHLYSTGEASRLARMSRERLLRRVQEGEIESRFIGGRYLIPASALADYLGRDVREAAGV